MFIFVSFVVSVNAQTVILTCFAPFGV
ncbi:pyroglutamyl-peptidase I, partial [Francisella tularensis subsp. holarctica]|nr:pyroglutamyl-peptidase I [Francisella tularensis subsp. holarctica]